MLRGTAKFRLMDERVRYFVGPGQEALETTDVSILVYTDVWSHGHERLSRVQLKPYVSTQVKSNDLPRLPLFAPNAQPRVGSDSLTRNDFTRFSKRYQRLQPEERHALILDSRRKWWDAVSQTFQV